MTDAAFWNRIAEKYSRDPVKDTESYEATLDRVGAYLSANDRVLEVGCGTGGAARRLSRLVSEYVASDISVEMIRIARERQSAEGTQVRFEARPLDAAFPEAPFDVVTAFSVLHLTGDLDQTLAAVSDLLRPGGLFIAKTPCLRDTSLAIRLSVPVMRLVGKVPEVTFFGATDLVAAICAAGFEIVEQTTFGRDRNRLFSVARRR